MKYLVIVWNRSWTDDGKSREFRSLKQAREFAAFVRSKQLSVRIVRNWDGLNPGVVA